MPAFTAPGLVSSSIWAIDCDELNTRRACEETYTNNKNIAAAEGHLENGRAAIGRGEAQLMT